ncbi:MAG: replication initiation protein RepC [Rhodobacteraceae bacterium]|nr:replication initiation protein RepC [Paracoccaceae bacterium]
MQHISLTPFGRQPVTAGLLAARRQAEKAPALPSVDKWSLFNDLRTARLRFGVADRDLVVLYALLSFLPAKSLLAEADLVVFPSNAALSDRAHGMAESTLRRHLAVLVRAGLIWRQDSPNGKRYAARDRSGALSLAFGFDLRPLLNRAEEIARAAAEAIEAADALRRAREAFVLRLRDATKLLAYGREAGLPGDWDAIEARLLPLRAALRRRQCPDSLAGLLDAAGDILRILGAMLSLPAEKTSGSAAHSGRHHTNSKPDSSDSEPCQELAKAAAVAHEPQSDTLGEPLLPLYLVLKACPDIRLYARSNLTDWRDLIVAAAEVRGMMGISAAAWDEAQRLMSPATAAVAVCAMLQKVGSIHNPGGYLRALSGKAAAGGFSPGPMIMALLNGENRAAT